MTIKERMRRIRRQITALERACVDDAFKQNGFDNAVRQRFKLEDMIEEAIMAGNEEMTIKA